MIITSIIFIFGMLFGILFYMYYQILLSKFNNNCYNNEDNFINDLEKVYKFGEELRYEKLVEMQEKWKKILKK